VGGNSLWIVRNREGIVLGAITLSTEDVGLRESPSFVKVRESTDALTLSGKSVSHLVFDGWIRSESSPSQPIHAPVLMLTGDDLTKHHNPISARLKFVRQGMRRDGYVLESKSDLYFLPSSGLAYEEVRDRDLTVVLTQETININGNPIVVVSLQQ
jgi:hypothetical protein